MNTKSSQITLKEQTDSTLVDISINFSIILPQVCNFVTLLIIIRDMVFKLGREIFVGILEQLDETICGKRKQALRNEGIRFRVSSHRNRKIMTPFGEISFKYRTLEINDQNNAPLLESLGITTKTRIFPEACEDMLKGCLFTSFRKALNRGGGGVSLGSLWNCFQQWGAGIRQKEKEAFEFFREGEKETAESQYPLAVVMIDGIWNQMQKDKRNRKGKPVESPEKKSGHFELKSCRVMFGKIVDGVWEWTKAKVHANNCSSEAFLKECRDFLDSTLQLYNVPNIFVISDAASWIKKFCNFYPQAVHQLDWWHLWKKVKTLHFFNVRRSSGHKRIQAHCRLKGVMTARKKR